MPRRTIGIEIAPEAIRLVRVVSGWRHAHVDGWQVRAVPPADHVDHRSAVVQALRELSGAGWFKGDQIVVSLTGDQVISRTVAVPFQDPQKIAQVLAYEVEALLPFDLDQVVIGPAAIETTPTGSRVLAVALPKSRLTALLEMTTEAGLDPSVVEVGAIGLARFAQAAFPPAEGAADETIAVVELGQTMTTVALCRGGRLAQFRTISGGEGRSLPEGEALLAELKRMVHFYELEERSPVAALYCCGVRAPEIESGGVIDRLVEQLGVRRLGGIPSWLWPPGSPSGIGPSGGESAALPFVQAIGLALRQPEERLNFRQAEFMSPRERSRMRVRSIGLVALLGVVLLLGGANLFLRYYMKEHLYAGLKSEQRALFTRAFPAITVVVNELEQAKSATQVLTKRAAFLGDGEPGALMILERLTDSLQTFPELKVDHLQINGGDVRFEGEVGSFEVVDRVRELLKQIESADRVEISDTRMSADQQHVRFKAALVIGSSTVGVGAGGGGAGKSGTVESKEPK